MGEKRKMANLICLFCEYDYQNIITVISLEGRLRINADNVVLPPENEMLLLVTIADAQSLQGGGDTS